jgi:two-component system chemotaxis response regulator CheB
MKKRLGSSVYKRVEAVVLGASAGGIDALYTLLHELPANWRLPMAVVLHLPEDHDSHLAEIFAQRLPIPVHEAADKMPLAAAACTSRRRATTCRSSASAPFRSAASRRCCSRARRSTC